uniref:Elapor1/2 mannose 6-phosphate receptor homology domain-containing protein n=1 Tax=Globodera pallida TaxID=36090 RepID=A0A183C277_GLOPA
MHRSLQNSKRSDSATPKDHLPLDVHFFFQPSSASPSTSTSLASNCPNGTLGVITVRCESSLVTKPLARLSRQCPDGTCDGCLYHVLVESAHGCPLCRPEDFREIRGECTFSIKISIGSQSSGSKQ